MTKVKLTVRTRSGATFETVLQAVNGSFADVCRSMRETFRSDMRYLGVAHEDGAVTYIPMDEVGAITLKELDDVPSPPDRYSE